MANICCHSKMPYKNVFWIAILCPEFLSDICRCISFGPDYICKHLSITDIHYMVKKSYKKETVSHISATMNNLQASANTDF